MTDIDAQIAKPAHQLGWGPSASLFVSLLAYITSQLILVLPALLIVFISGNNDVESILAESAWLQLVLTGISSIGLLAVLWLFLRNRKLGFKNLGFAKIKATDFAWLAIAVLGYFVALSVALVIVSNVPGFDSEQTQDIGYGAVAGWQLLFAFIGLVILPPLAEEMMFRGFMYRGLAGKWPKLVAALITSLLFAVVHFQWNVGVDVFVLSLVLIWLYERTNNLWMCVFLHAFKNGLAFLALFVFAS